MNRKEVMYINSKYLSKGYMNHNNLSKRGVRSAMCSLETEVAYVLGVVEIWKKCRSEIPTCRYAWTHGLVFVRLDRSMWSIVNLIQLFIELPFSWIEAEKMISYRTSSKSHITVASEQNKAC